MSHALVEAAKNIKTVTELSPTNLPKGEALRNNFKMKIKYNTNYNSSPLGRSGGALCF